MVGGACIYAGWATRCCVRAEKEKVASAEPQVELARSGRSREGIADQSGESESDYLLASVFSLFVGDSVGAGARWGISC